MKPYSLIELMNAYNDNKHIINAYIKNQSIEGYTQDVGPAAGGAILGMTVGIFFLFFIISLALWIWAVILLVKNWNVIPDWAKVLGVLGVLPVIPGGSIVTILVVLLSKQSR
jgi:hypothetical protein